MPRPTVCRSATNLRTTSWRTAGIRRTTVPQNTNRPALCRDRPRVDGPRAGGPPVSVGPQSLRTRTGRPCADRPRVRGPRVGGPPAGGAVGDRSCVRLRCWSRGRGLAGRAGRVRHRHGGDPALWRDPVGRAFRGARRHARTWWLPGRHARWFRWSARWRCPAGGMPQPPNGGFRPPGQNFRGTAARLPGAPECEAEVWAGRARCSTRVPRARN